MQPDTLRPPLRQKAASEKRGPALPRAPVLDWSSFGRTPHPVPPGIEQLPHQLVTTSGRAALYHALLQLRLPAGSTVLVPAYHCPTMVAPILRAGLVPHFVGLQADGLPALERIEATALTKARALIAAHYFGIPRSFGPLRAWCDRHGVALIEDCAHCLFGQAGERAVGHWGDFATASLTKFLPVPEAGLLASASRPIGGLALAPPGFKAQAKGCLDVLETAAEHGRLAGLDRLLGPLFRLKRQARRRRGRPAAAAGGAPGMMDLCDMDRIAREPLAVSLLLGRVLPRGRIAARRRENFARYAERFAGLRGVRPLFGNEPAPAAPYVFPLWVDDPEPAYRGAHELGLPVLRWDRAWPGTVAPPGDASAGWGRHVLQLLCHQDLRPEDVDHTARVLGALVRRSGPSPLSLASESHE